MRISGARLQGWAMIVILLGGFTMGVDFIVATVVKFLV